MNGGYQSQVSVESYRGQKAVIKRVLHPRVPLVRDLEGWVLNREVRALKLLRDVPQVPDFLGRPDRYSFAMQYVDGRTLRERDPETLPSTFFIELGEVVERMHAVGVVHSDLKKKENVLATPRDTPVLIDFGTSFFRQSNGNPVMSWLYGQFKQIDRNAVAKYKRRYCPEALSVEEKEGLEQPVFLEKISRFGNRYILFRAD